MPASARSPAPATTLLKILRQEEKRGFDDGAVSGGLDGFLRGALTKLEGGGPLLRLVAALPRAGYASLSAEQRADWARGVRRALDQAASRPPAEGRSAPGAARGPAAKPAGASKAPLASARRAASSKSTPRPAQRAAMGDPLTQPVTSLSPIRAPTREKLERLGVSTIEDMLWYLPHRHVDFTNVKQIAELVMGETATVIGTVRKSRVAFMRGRRRATEATIADESGSIRAMWFNQPYLARQLPEGARVGLAGKVGDYRRRPQFESPEWERLDDDEDGAHVGRLVPVYPLTRGLPGRTVRKLAHKAVTDYLPLIAETLPPEVLEETGYLSERDALQALHFPNDLEEREQARERLAFQELFAIQLAVLSRKRRARERQDAPVIPMSGEFVQRFVDELPFQLTNAQIGALTEIRGDIGRAEPMARLLQGDVGSGKTVVAAAAMLGAVAAGYQAALMAPTEVLADQHFGTFDRIFGGAAEGSVFHNYTVAPALGRPVRMALLTGSTPAARKREIRRRMESGELDVIVGTHALIEEGVALANLGLAVVDEQHRFGVLQRDALRGKGGSPHLLVMTATPIPRTLALTVYGDLDASRLNELPPGRHPVETHVIEPNERAEVYDRIRDEVAAGRQVFIICPLVEESEALEATAATDEYERLRRDLFPDLAESMRLLHGRMAAHDKAEAMGAFHGGSAKILVSTVVVEVGVDVPNATVIAIEGADRFGLAQLHQLRGRVGRSDRQSYCYLVSESENEAATRRLRLMERTGDGFELAEADLEMRGPGEYFGTRQSGLPDLRVAKLTDHALLMKARNFAERILDRDPYLRAPEHQQIARKAALLHVDGAEAVH